MFIQPDPESEVGPARSETLIAEKYISLPRSEAALFRQSSINISPLCGDAAFLFRTLETHA
jgi:hypothetical protein